MRLASYKVENLFNRAKAMNHGSWLESKPILDGFAQLSQLLGEHLYDDVSKRRMVGLLQQLGLTKSDTGEFVMLRQNRGDLVRRPKAGGIEIVADGRTDWVGSLELIPAPINEEAMRNTARVMIELKTDVLAVVEAESRPTLVAFNTGIVGGLGGTPFAHVMLIDGNDMRGIDAGLLSGEGFPIGSMRSHVDDRSDTGQLVFSRNCPKFELTLPSGSRQPAASQSLQEHRVRRQGRIGRQALTAGGACQGDLRGAYCARRNAHCRGWGSERHTDEHRTCSTPIRMMHSSGRPLMMAAIPAPAGCAMQPTRSSDERVISCVIACSTVECSALSNGLRPRRPDWTICIFLIMHCPRVGDCIRHQERYFN